MALLIANNLLLLGSATFNSITSTGFTTLNYSQANPGSIVTLKAGTTYTVTGQLTITGTAASRCTLQSDTKFSASGSITTNQLTCPITLSPTLALKPAGSEYLVSQSPANTAVLKRGITGLNGSDVTLLASFPSIIAGTASPYTLSKTVVPPVTTRVMQVGLTTKFIHSGSIRNLDYVTTFDIDSRTSSSTLLANNSYQNRTGVPNPNLWRSINWGELNLLPPLVTVAYVE